MQIETTIKLNKFIARPYQVPLVEAFNAGKIKRLLAIWPRRSGKDLVGFNLIFRAALKKVGTYFYIFPTFSSGRRILWDAISNDGTRVLSFLPPELIESKNEQSMRLRLINGSVIQIVGSDNYDNSLVGTNSKGMIFSEYALQDERAYQFARPILTANDGFAMFLTTPRGKNHLWTMYNIAKESEDWFVSKLTIDDTQHIALWEIEKERQSGEMSDDLIMQEYYCFTAGHQISMEVGYKNIEDIKVGDRVMTLSGAFMNVEKHLVREYDGNILEIVLDNNKVINSTPDHPFFVFDSSILRYKWKQAKYLKIDDILCGEHFISYKHVPNVQNINISPYKGKVYNLSVEGDPTYFVNGVLVHNCSFDMGIEGAYYAKYLDRMRLKGQIGIVPHEEGFKVHTAWDLGVRDNTTIIFFQVIGQLVRIIDSYEKNKEGLEHYVKVLQAKPYSYGKHIAPHDIKVKEFGSGMTRLEKAKQLGIQFTIAPDVSIVDGIESVRSAFSKIWIDERTCGSLIKSLENYRQEFDIKRKIYKPHPLHDQFSHFADCMRYLCISLPKTRDGLSPEDLDKRYQEAIYGNNSNMPAVFRDDLPPY